MKKNVLISICGTQSFVGQKPETIELTTEGIYDYEPGHITICYAETEMTGMEGVQTTFTIEDDTRVTLTREGKLRSVMEFTLGQPHESLYDTGMGGLLIRVCASQITVLLNEKGGIFDFEYTIEIEQTTCGTHSFHIEVRPAAT